jgi:hypothetical protein
LKITFKHIDSIPEKLWKNKININNYNKNNKNKQYLNGTMNCGGLNKNKKYDNKSF